MWTEQPHKACSGNVCKWSIFSGQPQSLCSLSSSQSRKLHLLIGSLFRQNCSRLNSLAFVVPEYFCNQICWQEMICCFFSPKVCVCRRVWVCAEWNVLWLNNDPFCSDGSSWCGSVISLLSLRFLTCDICSSCEILMSVLELVGSVQKKKCKKIPALLVG